MINSKIEYTENGSPRFFIEASDAPHYTKLFHSLVKHIDHKPAAEYDIKTNIWKSEDKTYIEIDIKRWDRQGMMFHVLKEFIDRLKEHDINIWSILPSMLAEDGFITLNGGFTD